MTETWGSRWFQGSRNHWPISYHITLSHITDLCWSKPFIPQRCHPVDGAPRQADSMPLIMYGRTSLSILASLGLTNLQLLQALGMQDMDILWYLDASCILLLGWGFRNLPIAIPDLRGSIAKPFSGSQSRIWLYDCPIRLCHALPRARSSWRLCFCCMRRMALCCRAFSRPGRQMLASAESMWLPGHQPANDLVVRC